MLILWAMILLIAGQNLGLADRQARGRRLQATLPARGKTLTLD